MKDANKKNVAIIVPTLNKGGAERVAANLSVEFNKLYNVYLIVHDGRDITYPYKGQLIDLQLPPGQGVIAKTKTLLKRVMKVRQIKKTYCIDYTISHLPPSNYVNIFSRVNDKVFCYVHSMEKWSLGTCIRENVTSWFSDKLICVSKCVEKNMNENFYISANKTITIYNFCEPKQTVKAEKTNAEIMIANMGRLSEPKGQWHLIRAMKEVVARHKEARLSIYGDGEYRSMLEQLIVLLDMQDYVKLEGFVSNPHEKLVRADIYVSSSLWEGLPMALIEAAGCGLPIISTDCDAGCREVLAPETPIDSKTSVVEESAYGILIPEVKEGNYLQTTLTATEHIMAEAIISLIEDKEKRMKYSHLSKVRAEEFLPREIMKKWVELIN